MKIEFNANVSLGASSYKWFFGDGDSGVGKVVTHIYDTPGLFYNVTLITSNNCADSASITKSLTTIGTIEKEILPLKIWPTTLMPGQKIYFTNNNSAEPRNRIKIFDSNGRLMNGHNISDGIEIPYHWPIGSYILSINHHIYKFILTQ
jgi:PKD repeat protein